jgi:N-acetyl-anhydromuramyl-L-alanine amidase AmpD
MTLNIIEYGNFKPTGNNIKKRQIILTHTSRTLTEYLTSLKHRKNGRYDKIPNYLISRDGKILKLLSNDGYTNYIDDDKLNKKSITICYENLGWLEKEPLKKSYINWIGNIYNGKVLERRWRDYIFWQPYTDIQMENSILLIKLLCDEFSIPKKFVGHNTKINGLGNFEGILTRSNYNTVFTDVSPAFDFNLFNEKLNDE